MRSPRLRVHYATWRATMRPGLLFLALCGVPLLPAAWNISTVMMAQDTPSAVQTLLALALAAALAAWFAARRLLPYVARLTFAAGLTGRDRSKRKSNGDRPDAIPEAMGLVPALVFLVVIICVQPSLRLLQHVGAQVPLAESNAALLSVSMMVLLGFADDVLELRWAVKVVLPAVAALPLLVAYSGITEVVVPVPLRDVLAASRVDLGILYYLFMLAVAVFASQSINIYAGINGLEVGQSIVIACFVLLHNSMQLIVAKDQMLVQLFSIIYMLPFLTTSLALLSWNWYPSLVFVGDTYCYWAGMTLAVVGILGHFSKTLLLFFLPQVLNFLLSLPQLMRLVPCPRHRLPKYNEATDALECVPTHYTLINAWLYLRGPLSEHRLTNELLAFQVGCCLLGLYIRYPLAMLFYESGKY